MDPVSALAYQMIFLDYPGTDWLFGICLNAPLLMALLMHHLHLRVSRRSCCIEPHT